MRLEAAEGDLRTATDDRDAPAALEEAPTDASEAEDALSCAEVKAPSPLRFEAR